MPLNGIPALQGSPTVTTPPPPVPAQATPDPESLLRLFKQAAGAKAGNVRLATPAEKARVNMPLNNDDEDAVVVFMDIPENVSQEELTDLMRTLKLAREEAARHSAQVQATEHTQQEENKPGA